MIYDAGAIAAVFGRTAATYDTVIPFFAELGARLVDFAALQPGEAVLDVGSGRGATLLPAAERVGARGRVLGVDLSEAMVALLQADIDGRGLAHASIREMDAGALSVEPGSFDVALSSFVLHLLPDPERAAAGLVAALRPGGRCVAAAPTGSDSDWDFMVEIIGTYARRAARPMVVPFRPDFDLAAVLAGAGFEVTRTAEERVQFHFADPQGWWDWAWTVGLRGLFEALVPAELEGLKQELCAGLAAKATSAGIAMYQTAAFVVAEKPAG